MTTAAATNTASLVESYARGATDVPLIEQTIGAFFADMVVRQPEREALVLQLYFVEELNLEEIGQTLDIGAARVCQIKKSALDKLRGKLSDWN